MKRGIWIAGRVDPIAVTERVLGRVPAADRQVEAAGKGHLVVHHNELLVLGSTRRHGAVETEMKPLGRRPVEAPLRQPFALAGIQNGKVPEQHMDMQARPFFDEGREKKREFGRIAVVDFPGLAHQQHAAMEIPAEQKERALRLQQRFTHRAEKFSAIDQGSSARRALDLPDIDAGPQNFR